MCCQQTLWRLSHPTGPGAATGSLNKSVLAPLQLLTCVCHKGDASATPRPRTAAESESGGILQV